MNGKWEGYNQATPTDLKALHCCTVLVRGTWHLVSP